MWNVSLVQFLSRSTIQRFWVSQSELFIPDLVDNSGLISHFTWLKYIRHLALNTSKCMTLGLTVTVPPACKVLLNTSCCCLSFPSSIHNHHVLRRAQRKWHHRQVELIKQKVLFEYQLPDAAAVAKKTSTAMQMRAKYDSKQERRVQDRGQCAGGFWVRSTYSNMVASRHQSM